MSQPDFFGINAGFKNKNGWQPAGRQTGASLIVSLILLLVISMLGISAAQIAIEGDKAARSDRDRQIAFQAAEAALTDAELDIENSPDAGKSRSHIFSKTSALGFPEGDDAGCRGGEGNIYLGLCSHSSTNAKPVWLTANLTGASSSTVNSVAYGTFTGKSYQAGTGTLPVRLPRYLIELMIYKPQGEAAGQVSYFYRVTAIGFGTKEATSVVLQTLYRKESKGSEDMKVPDKRFSWREIANWQELRNAESNQ